MLSTLLQPWPKCTGADANKVLDELDVYLKEPLETKEEGEFDLSFSPLQYWKLNEHSTFTQHNISSTCTHRKGRYGDKSFVS